MNRYCFPLLFVMTLAAVGCGTTKPGAAAGESEKSQPVSTIAVPTAVAAVQQVPVFTSATGTFVAEESSDVAPLTAGRVIATPVDVGAFVERGAVIARLDDSDAQLRLRQAQANADQTAAALRQAEAKIGLSRGTSFNPDIVPEVQASKAAYESALAEVKLAEADARRYANLVKTGDVSRSNYEKQLTQAETATARANSAKRQYEAAVNAARQNYQGIESAQGSLGATEAQLAIAKKAIADTIVRAPISGYVSERPLSVGEYVSTSSKIATILRANPIKLQLQVPEADTGSLQPGMPVVISVAAFGAREFTGRLSALNPAVDANSRAMTVEAKFENPKFELRPGMFATARILMPDTEESVTVPRSAVLSDASTESAQIFVVENGVAKVRVVRLGDEDQTGVRVLSGVKKGETVATGNLQQLFDGAPVKVN